MLIEIGNARHRKGLQMEDELICNTARRQSQWYQLKERGLASLSLIPPLSVYLSVGLQRKCASGRPVSRREFQFDGIAFRSGR